MCVYVFLYVCMCVYKHISRKDEEHYYSVHSWCCFSGFCVLLGQRGTVISSHDEDLSSDVLRTRQQLAVR